MKWSAVIVALCLAGCAGGSTQQNPNPTSTNITGVSVSATADSAIVPWTTNVMATSRVDYGLTTQYGSLVSDPSLVTRHSLTLTSLACNSMYHYRVTSVSAAGDSASTGDATFKTNACGTGTGPTIANLQLSPNPVIGGSPSQGTIQATAPAPAGGAAITLSSSNTSAATVPNSVTIPAGATTAAFSVTTKAVANSTSAIITATGPNSGSVSSTLGVTANGQDIALTASVSVSSENVNTGQLGIKAIDGVIDGYPGDSTKEWATVGELGLRSGSSAYAWIRLDWSYVTLSEVDLYDRPNLSDNITSGAIDFSDGSSINIGALPSDGSLYQATFAPKNVSWLRFRVNSADGSNSGLAEIKALGTCAITPSVRIGSPLSEYLQVTPNFLTITAQTCLDQVNNAGWGVRFLLDGGPGSGGAQMDTHAAPYRVSFSNLSLAEHTVDAYLIDSNGNIVSGNGTHDQVNHIGFGDYYVAMGDSISEGLGDNITSDDISNDGRNGPNLAITNCACGGGGYEPILNNLLTAQKGRPQTVVNESVGGSTSSDGVNIINTTLARNPVAQMFLVQYGTNDANPQGTVVPSGLNLNPGDPGYAGSFKDHLQQIINAVNAAGRRIALAKPPMALSDCANCTPFPNPSTAPKNVMIQQYNQVIDQLVSNPANNISVVPPDFYTFFSNNQSQYADLLHPNGVGYQSMANIWAQALTH